MQIIEQANNLFFSFIQHNHLQLPTLEMMLLWWTTSSIIGIGLAFILLFRNSLPFVWTIRMMTPYWRLRFRDFRSRSFYQSNSNSADRKSFERIPSAQGCDPFEDQFTFKRRATLDECDFMGHLSNSAYPKNLDLARMQFSVNRLADFMLDGGWIALGSTSFQFHHEIPLLAKYKIVSRIETWNDKWLFVRNEYRGKTRKGEHILFCTSITKHCFKYGHKTIPPWFVLAYCGYSSTSGATLIKTNATRSRELRQSLQKEANKKAINPLQAFQKITPISQHKSPSWCSPDQWDVAGWENQRRARLSELNELLF